MLGSQYGIGGGRNENYFTVNRDEGIIYFKKPVHTKVVLQYKGCGITIDKEITIPRRLFNAIKAQIKYQITANIGTKNPYFREEYIRQMSLVIANERGFTYDEIGDMLCKNEMQAAQR